MNRWPKIALALSLTALPATVPAAPDGYSINSDSPSADADSLYRIDLATGAHTRLGRIQSQGQTRLDVEGLAFAPDGTLYGADDESLRLFPINIDNGAIVTANEVNLTGLPSGGGNDFGMTFGCDGNLYVTSVNSDSLYVVGLDGVASIRGAPGSLGANISGLAAWGNPVELYGLGNGLTAGGAVDSRTLYRIDTTNGTAVALGQLGGAAASYHESGLAFDSSGQLWAITDRRSVAGGPFPSQVLRVDKTNGAATLVSSTTETGFESLAITIPRGCGTGGGENARFTVQKRFVDGNDVTPVTLNISCNTGLPLQQSIDVEPNDGLNGAYEVEFVVTGFDSGEMTCSVTETPPPGYSAAYTCLGESDCGAAQSVEKCTFTSVESGSENLCQVQNYPLPVEFSVVKEWLFQAEELGSVNETEVQLECQSVFGGDGEAWGNSMSWSWQVEGNQTLTAHVQPMFDGSTRCRAEEYPVFSAVEAENGCAEWITVPLGAGALSCSIVNTVFLEGIPTLNDYGKLLFALLLLATGLVVMRRA